MATKAEKKQSGQKPERKMGLVDGRTRVPFHGYRDVFNIEPKDKSLNDKYFHYWFFDWEEGGRRIHRARMAGYEFCPPSEYVVGQDMLYKPAQMDGSIIRIKETNGALYFMRIPMEWHLEDVAAKDRTVDETEQDMIQKDRDRDDGDYGDIKLDSTLARETFGR